MNPVTDDDIRGFVKKKLPLVTTLLLKKIHVDDQSALQEIYEADDIAEMVEEFFLHFNVKPAAFTLLNYYPWKIKAFYSGREINQDKKPLTITMFIESAKAGRWLYG